MEEPPNMRPEAKKEVSYLERYVKEFDPQKRLAMAEEFLTKGAGDRWIFVYSLASSMIVEESDFSRENADITEKVVKESEREGKINQTIELIDQYQKNYKIRKLFQTVYEKERDGDTARLKLLDEELERADNNEWNKIIEHFNVGENADAGMCLEWLRYMITSDKVVIGPRREANNGNTTILTAGLSVNTAEYPPILYITKDLIPPDRSAIDLLLGFQHERGHVAKVESRKYVTDEIGHQEIILNEFYPICEEYRLFHLLEPHLQSQVNIDGVEYLYKPNVSNKDYHAQIENSGICANIKMDVETFILYRAYVHSLQQNMRARKILYEKLVSVSDDKIAREFYSDLLRIKEHRPLITKEDTVWIAD